MIGAYTATEHFAYPGWRLTVPGGPAGGHYKGFTHTEAAGTDIPPQDQYEQDREDGMSSHDPVHASPRNPRGVYRSSAEVPPRPNASGSAMTYRGFQTQRHPGTSVAPGAFPAPFVETEEDAFLSGLGLIRAFDGDGEQFNFGLPDVPPVRRYEDDAGPQFAGRPNTAVYSGAPAQLTVPATGATSFVAQPVAQPFPFPPSPGVSVASAPPVSPRPAPVVRTREVLPHPDGSGNFIDVSTLRTVSPSDVEQNPATGQLTARGTLSWLEEHSLFSALPNWGILAGGLLLASVFMGHRR